MVLVAVGLCAFDYHSAKASFRADASEIAQTHVPLLAVALWDIENDAAQAQLDRIANRPQIAWVRLVTATGQTFLAGHAGSNLRGDVELAIPHPRNGTPLGRLTLAYNRDAFYLKTAQALGETLSGMLLLTVSVCLMLIAMMRRELQKPLARISEFCNRLSPTNLTAVFDLERPARTTRDEIDLVTESFATLHNGIERYVLERNRAMTALAEERDTLDQKVMARTADLTRINLFLETLSQLSTRFIHLPPDEYPEALRHTLSILARYLDIEACALAECDENGRYRWAFVHLRIPDSCRELVEGNMLAPLPEPPQLGWHIERWSSAPGTPVIDAFMERYGAGAMALYRHELAHTGRILACFAQDHYDWGQTGQRQLKIAADMLFSTLARWQDLKALDLTRRELWRMSRTDALTGLPNRRRFDEIKHEEVRRALRMQSPLAVMMIDVDWFKYYNDTYGHAAGDDCLVAVADILRNAFQRTGELAARLGGEEFVVMLPGSDQASAVSAAERTREAVQALELAHKESPLRTVTISIGLAVLHQESTQGMLAECVFEQLLRRADEALYVAKANGRNRVAALPLALRPTQRRDETKDKS
jgi:diguanylate cyclase (GGDEF)-like protein